MFKKLIGLILGGLLLTGCSPELALVPKANASILRITATGSEMTPFGPMTGEMVCTGFVVAPHRVLTAAHCVGDGELADGKPARLLKKDEYFDLALFEVDTPKVPLEFERNPVFQGETVYGIGYGWGWGVSYGMEERVVLPRAQIMDSLSSGILAYGGVVGGMSGGPVLDEGGQVVSINQQANKGYTFGMNAQTIRAFLFDAGVDLPITQPFWID